MSIFKRLSYLFLPLPVAASAVASDKHIRIGYKEAMAAANLSGAVLEKAAKLKWYFAHASVGANMMDGLADLNSQSKVQYPIRGIFSDKVAPAQTESGVIYEHNRGNPGWKSKFDQFENCVSNDWHFPKVDVVMNKLCYIDQGASFSYYIHSMTNLEAAFPQTIVVYMTMPLVTTADGNNYLRNAFNERVREWTRTNGKVLFDLADIESHDSEGKECTFSYRNKTCQKLCDTYTKDGGHLEAQGRQAAARGFYALAAALVQRQEAAPALSAQP